MYEKICGYARISSDDDLNDKNMSIEAQILIITNYVKEHYPGADFDPTVDIYVDRDLSGYEFEGRKGYLEMAARIREKKYNLLLLKDFTRFSRRVSHGALEAETLTEQGVRIIGISDGTDLLPNQALDPMTLMKLIFGQEKVTTTSRAVRATIAARQKQGDWICNVPYGYTYDKNGIYIDEEGAETVKKIFELYIDGYGYKSIAHYLTENKYPTGRALMYKHMLERGADTSKFLASGPINPVWSIVSIAKIVSNDFYIGTLRTGVWSREGIHGKDKRTDKSKHHVFENHHDAIIDKVTFAKAQKQLNERSRKSYAGLKKYKNPYTGLLFCADCGSRMYSISSGKRPAAYICGNYQKHGILGENDERLDKLQNRLFDEFQKRKEKNPNAKMRKLSYQGLGCIASHHVTVEWLNECVRQYLVTMSGCLDDKIAELDMEKTRAEAIDARKKVGKIEARIGELRETIKQYERARARKLSESNANEQEINELYDELVEESKDEITELENEHVLLVHEAEKKYDMKSAMEDVKKRFASLIKKKELDKEELLTLIERIEVDKDRIVTIQLHSEINEFILKGENK